MEKESTTPVEEILCNAGLDETAPLPESFVCPPCRGEGEDYAEGDFDDADNEDEASDDSDAFEPTRRSGRARQPTERAAPEEPERRSKRRRGE